MVKSMSKKSTKTVYVTKEELEAQRTLEYCESVFAYHEVLDRFDKKHHKEDKKQSNTVEIRCDDDVDLYSRLLRMGVYDDNPQEKAEVEEALKDYKQGNTDSSEVEYILVDRPVNDSDFNKLKDSFTKKKR